MTRLSQGTKAELDRILNSAVAEKKIPAVSFAVGTGDEKLYVGHAGTKAIHRPSSEVDDDSMYWLCSMAKPIVCIAFLQMIERGMISLETPVETILPEFCNPVVVTSSSEGSWVPAKNKIVMKHLLNHSSGLSYGIPFYEGVDRVESIPIPYQGRSFEGDHSRAKFFSLIQGSYPSIPLAFEAGTSWTYGWGMDICGFVVETLTGMDLQTHCHKFIFTPLNITPTYSYTERVRSNIVHLTYRESNGELSRWTHQYPIMEQDPSKSQLYFGGGAVYCSANDFLSTLQHILLAKEGRAFNPLLKAETVDLMFNHTIPQAETAKIEQFLECPDDIKLQFGYGLCVSQNDWPHRRRKGSGFWYGWAGLYCFIDPETSVVAVYATQVVPTRDKEVVALFERLEETLYKGLSTRSRSTEVDM